MQRRVAFRIGHENIGAIGFGTPRRAKSVLGFPRAHIVRLFLPIPSATLDPEPTEMNMRFPSSEKSDVTRAVAAMAPLSIAGR